MGSLELARAWWWFPLIVLPGLWMTARLYLRGPTVHRGPALLSALAWLALAVWAVSPAWRIHPEIWHPPLVVLAVDERPSYAALGARDSAERMRRAARAHYEARGFRVVETALADRLPGGSGYPNLQAVLLWSDARAPGLERARTSAPVFPVLVPVSTDEVQGESGVLALRGEGAAEGVTLTIEWRAAGTRPVSATGEARAELQAGGRTVWTGTLNHPPDLGRGERVISEVRLPPAMRELLERDDAGPVLLLRPSSASAVADDRHHAGNDTVLVDAARLHRIRQVFVRPVTTLEERGLMDALREEARFDVRALPLREVEALAARGRVVVWAAATRPADLPAGDAPVIRYDRATPAGRGVRSRVPVREDARIEPAAHVAAALPAGVLRLADLGFVTEPGREEAWGLPRMSEDVEPLAWAVQDGSRGLLFWRRRASGEYGLVMPALWEARFRPEARPEASRPGSPMAEWVQGAAWWAILQQPAAEASRPERSQPGGAVTGREPENPLARLGTDVEALMRLAARHGGRILQPQSAMPGAEMVWPELPEGQLRERGTRVIPLAPALPFALAVTCLLALLWVSRKRRRLD